MLYVNIGLPRVWIMNMGKFILLKGAERKEFIMVSKKNLLQREELFNIVYRLLDRYHRYGHLYGEDGNLKDRYVLLYTLEDGMCVDSEGRAIDYDPAADGLYNPEYDKYLDVHSCSVFADWDRDKVMSLSFEQIRAEYLADKLSKLVAMLRLGRNYAAEQPIGANYSDDYVVQLIAMAWKLLVSETVSCLEVKRKFMGMFCDEDYYHKEYAWDKRPYAGKLYEETEIRTISNFVGHKRELSDKEREAKYQKAYDEAARRQQELMDVINISMSCDAKAVRDEVFDTLASALK